MQVWVTLLPGGMLSYKLDLKEQADLRWHLAARSGIFSAGMDQSAGAQHMSFAGLR